MICREELIHPFLCSVNGTYTSKLATQTIKRISTRCKLLTAGSEVVVINCFDERYARTLVEIHDLDQKCQCVFVMPSLKVVARSSTLRVKIPNSILLLEFHHCFTYDEAFWSTILVFHIFSCWGTLHKACGMIVEILWWESSLWMASGFFLCFHLICLASMTGFIWHCRIICNIWLCELLNAAEDILLSKK
jgi:hypothetical protein